MIVTLKLSLEAARHLFAQLVQRSWLILPTAGAATHVAPVATCCRVPCQCLRGTLAQQSSCFSTPRTAWSGLIDIYWRVGGFIKGFFIGIITV